MNNVRFGYRCGPKLLRRKLSFSLQNNLYLKVNYICMCLVRCDTAQVPVVKLITFFVCCRIILWFQIRSGPKLFEFRIRNKIKAASGFDFSKFSSTALVVGRVRGCPVPGELFFCFQQQRRNGRCYGSGSAWIRNYL